MLPKDSTSTSSHGKLKFSSIRPTTNKHSSPTSNMANSKTRVPEVEPELSSRKRQHPSALTSAKKKIKVAPAQQEMMQESTLVDHEETPGFDEFVEKEPFSYHIEEDKDTESCFRGERA